MEDIEHQRQQGTVMVRPGTTDSRLDRTAVRPCLLGFFNQLLEPFFANERVQHITDDAIGIIPHRFGQFV
jgi:hypothetical protein